MKNTLAVLMTLIVLLGFSACADTDKDANASPDALPGASAAIPAATATPTPKPTETPAPTSTPEPSETPTGGDEEASPEAIWNAIYEKYSDTIPVTESVPPENLSIVTGVDAEKLESFVFQFPLMNVTATEFFIAECKEGELENVKEALMAHQAALAEQWKQYLPEQLELVENYVMETEDNFVFFAIAEKAREAADVFESFFA